MARAELLVVAFLAGCASADTVREAKSRPELGTTASFAGPCAQHWDPVHETARRLGWRIDEEDASNRFILASVPAGAFTWGEHIALRLRDDGAARCFIQVYSRRANAMNATATDWENEFFERYAAR